MPSCCSKRFQDSKMAFGTILIVFSFLATAKAECEIHEHVETDYDSYYNITDLGLAALLDNGTDAVDNFIKEVRLFTLLIPILIVCCKIHTGVTWSI